MLILISEMESIFMCNINQTELIFLYTYLGMLYTTYSHVIQIHRAVDFYPSLKN
jgi:hypothetical protein